MKCNFFACDVFFPVILFSLGFLGIMVRKNILFILLGIEIMINASYILFINTDSIISQLNGHIIYIFSIIISASNIIINLSFALKMYRSFQNLNIDFKN